MSTIQEIRLELESHLIDAADELSSPPLDGAVTHPQSLGNFGPLEVVTKSVLAVESKQTMTGATAGKLGMLLGIIISLGLWLQRYPLNGAVLQPIILSIVYIGIFALVLLSVKWVAEFWGMQTRKVLWLSLIFSTLVNLAITIVYDVDNIFVPLELLLVGVGIAFPLGVWWPSMSIFSRRIFLYTFALFATWSALFGQAVLEFVFPAPCVYVTPDNVPLTGLLASCQQVAPGGMLLWPLYALAGVGIFFIAIFLKKYWQNPASALRRKIIISIALSAVPIVPLAVHDVNNYGRIDIIAWRPAIVQAYQDILGRNPQPKDMEFYALTEAYQNMTRVKSVLFASYERRLKIDLLHQEVLHRHASPAEIQFFVDRQYPVKKIRQLIPSF